MVLMIAGIGIELLITLSLLVNPVIAADLAWFFYPILGFWSLSLVGLLAMLSGRRKAGRVLVTVGSIAFMPIGLMAIFGARAMVNSEAGHDLDARRRAAMRKATAPAD